MKREKIEALNERDLLYGIITSDRFCREICPVLEPRLLDVEYARIISSWVKDYYDKFKVAPQKDISKLYRSHVDDLNDDALKDNVLAFLDKLDRDYEDIESFNDEYAIQQTIGYLKKQSLKNLNLDIDSFLTTGDITKAEDAITKYKTIEKSTGEAVSIMNNVEAVVDSYSEEKGVLFTLPKAYGSVVGKIHREDFISFLAPMKRGKTWALIDVGVNAVSQGMKVLFVSLEMSESDVIKRYWMSLTGQLMEERNDIPYSYLEKDGDRYVLEEKTISRKKISIGDIAGKQKAMKRMFRGGDIRVLSVPAYSLTVDALETKIERLVQQEEFVPDVILIDYADIMMPSEKGEYRHQIDGIWKRLRSLAQKRKVALFTASQSGRASISKDVDSEDISEDIRKLAHVTSMVSINQSKDERKAGVVRLKQLAVREGEMEYRQAVCTQCLAIGRFVTDSCYDDEITLEVEDGEEETNINRRRRN